MLRDKNLVPYSHQHQHALALCVRIERGLRSNPGETDLWQEEIQELIESEARFHFAAEERFLFPVARKIATLEQLVRELVSEHLLLLRYADQAVAGVLRESDLLAFAALLSKHVRREEEELFETLQRELSTEELEGIGGETTAFFRENEVLTRACELPSEP